ncbi:MAG: hypothetical protein RLZ67_1083 [Actinomycetota bacterium]|jgi:uncharacterized membrane protein YphA (DoxX/SURF4 family)
MAFVSSVLAIVLIVLCALSALMDFVRPPQIVQTMSRLKIPAQALPVLGAIKVVLCLGLAIGFSSLTIGRLSGIALCVYFAVATTTHTRVKDPFKDTLPAFTHLVLSVLYTLVMFAR